jgi:large repetitive protein
MKRLAPLLVLAALVAAVAATPGSTASFNDSAPCPADGPLLVCPTMTVGQPVNLQLLAHDGCDVYRWEIVIGGLPAGLSMSSSGLVTGTPTTAGTTQPWIWVHDLTAAEGGPSWCGGDNHSERQFVFTVVGGGGSAPPPAPAPKPAPPPKPPLQITTASLPRATEGASYTTTLAASGGGSQTWTLSSGSLPAGVSLGSDGVLSGTPTSAGSYTFTVSVQGDGRSTSRQFELDVVQKLTATAPADQTWEVGRPLQISIDAKGGVPGYSWKMTGTLPGHTGFVGDKGNGSTSFLQGVPADAGTFPLVLTVTDAAGSSAQVTLTLTVAPKLQIKTFAVGRARTGKRYSLTLTSTGGVGDKRWTLAAGALPAGLMLDPTAGVISGSTRRPGKFRFTVAVTDSLGAKAGMTYRLVVRRR